MTLSWMFSELEHRRGRGGGGKLRIRLGRTGPRGRMYSSARTPRSGGTCIVKATYVRTSKDSGRHIGAHLRYVEERERGEKEKERDFFDRERGEPELNRSWETFESDRQTKGQEQERGGDDDEERRGRGHELDRGNDLGR